MGEKWIVQRISGAAASIQPPAGKKDQSSVGFIWRRSYGVIW